MNFIKAVLIFTLIAAGSNALAYAPPGDVNPVGKYADPGFNLPTTAAGRPAGWKPQWSEAFFKCAARMPEAQAYFKKMSNGEISDVGSGKSWCPVSEVYRPENTRLFQLLTFMRLAKPESGYKESATNPKSPNPPAVGLFQIGPSDVENHKCTTPEGKPMYTGTKYRRGAMSDSRVAMLKKGENNICCALKIAAKTGLSGKGKGTFATNNKGAMGQFWEPMRVQKSKGAMGEKLRSQINSDCKKAMTQPDRFFTAAEVSGARRMPASAADASGATGSAPETGR